MKLRWVYALLPVVGTLLVAAGYTALGASLTRGTLTAEYLLIYGGTGFAAALAAASFGRGDYLRGAWGLMALCYALLFVDTLLFGAETSTLRRDPSVVADMVGGALTLVANLATVVSLAWVARAWSVAGLDLQVSKTVFRGSIVVVIALSLGLMGDGLWLGALELAHGRFGTIRELASTLGDVISTALLVPLLLTALSLRGGSLAWTWSLLTASTAVWLGLDVLVILAGDAGPMLVVSEALRVGACLFQLTAALAQRDVVRL